MEWRESCRLRLAFRGQSQCHAVSIAFGFYGKAGMVAVARLQTLADVHQAYTASASRRSIGIETVLDRDGQCAVLRMDVEVNPAALDEIGDAVHDGVLDEWLQKQRRDRNVQSGFVNILFHLDASAEAHFFDRQKSADQGKLFFERYGSFFSEA